MKEGINDKILNEIKRLNDLGVKEIVKQTKGSKPFASKEVPPEELIVAVDSLGQQDFGTLANEFGFDALNKFLYRVHLLKSRRK